MNPTLESLYGFVTGTHQLRDQVLNLLTDADLNFSPGGSNKPFSALWRDMGEVQHSYTESFTTHTQDWTWRSGTPGVENSVDSLRAWFKSLDAALHTTIDGLTDMQTPIVRGSGFELSPLVQLDIYLQAVLIFMGKATVYLRAMNKTLPQGITDWIG